ncbi:hypothetical protein JMA_12780 [Jeotgalibacillus malaysiensis]|uniref:Uncharacterized protein n=1 Tax=Jeotgalibacillus malaysiensis TaxID=1508404 RepID=A0A0B5AJS4_9BACL|nr:hypothetical protein JMA_12780 [Jeotgalibacillus malaysiensis]
MKSANSHVSHFFLRGIDVYLTVYEIDLHFFIREVFEMGTVLILGICVAFLAAIFSAGYNDKPGKTKNN